MSNQYLTTNVLLETLSLNLDTYASGPKEIDTLTLTQVEKLIEKMQQFLSDCTLVPFVGDAQTRDKLMKNFCQKPDTVRCQMCSKFINKYEAAIEHIKQHEEQLNQLLSPKPIIKTFVKKNCIPRTNEKLPKKMRKFLTKNPNILVVEVAIECTYVQNDIDNDRALKDLETFLQPYYPAVKCYPFGSRIVGTGSFSSDLDVFVDLNNVYYGNREKTLQEEVALTESIKHIETILSRSREWSIDAAILNARVPVMRIVSSIYDKLRCDLTFSNGLAHRNSLLLKYMFGLQPTARQLVCYLKCWNRESCLNSYTLSLMVIYLYQCRKLLPSVAQLQEDATNDIIIDGWNAGFATPTLEELGLNLWQSSILDLANMFFDFYRVDGGHFSVETQVVCPFLGNVPVKKSSFEPPNYDGLPAQMGRLKNYLLAKQQVETNPKHLFANHRPFVVQDPFELSHNVAKAIPVEIASRLMHWIDLSMALVADMKEEFDGFTPIDFH